MRDAPRFRRDVCLTAVSPGEILVCSDEGDFLLETELHRAVAPLIDGRRSEARIAALLQDRFALEEVYYSLELLRSRGWLADGASPRAPSEEETAWRELGIKASGIRTVLDAGANRGQFLISALRCLRPEAAAAIEMQADILEIARRNVALFRLPTKVRYFCCAVGPEPRRVRYRRCRFSPASSLLDYRPEAGEWFRLGLAAEGEAECDMRTLDDIRSEAGFDTVDLLKLDLEGFELPALRGAAETLRRTRHLIVEAHFTQVRRGEDRFEVLAAHLHRAGFHPARLFNLLSSPSGALLSADVLFARGPRRLLWPARERV
jgi:FkbM family methyltransferase